MDVQIDRDSPAVASALTSCAHLGISEGDIARVTGASLDEVHSWVRRTTVPNGEQAEKLASLAALATRLARVVVPATISTWLRTSVPALGGATPLDRLASGEQRAVARLVSGLEDPGAS